VDAVTADFQPAFQEIELRAFAGAVNSFDHNQGAGILALGRRLFDWERLDGGRNF
jgi:hypothetical protein